MSFKQSLDFDWRFHLGDILNAERPDHNDSTWRSLNVPHDWSIEGEYSEDHPTGWQGGYLPCGIGWYRRELKWSNDWTGKRVEIQFDGVYMNSDVWINGIHQGNRPYGYSSFRYDLTPHLNQTQNVIAVRVDHENARSGRWYTGSGIYRHVWINISDPLHLDPWQTFITTPNVSATQATVQIQTDVINTHPTSQSFTLSSYIKDKNGTTVGTASSENTTAETVKNTQTCTITNPVLWSPDQPILYTLEQSIQINNQTIDTQTIPFGIRKIEFSPQWGFKLNDQRVKMKGVCWHHDAGPVGSAVPRDVLIRRFQILKKMGCNAIRTAHNPYSPEFYDLCDRFGFMVMNEAFDGWDTPKADHDYGNYFNDWWERDLGDFIRRDRNHPCVVLWSIGNEVRKPTTKVQKQLIDLCHKLDPTRPVTQGGLDPTRGMKQELTEDFLDIVGLNGNGEEVGELEKFHERGEDRCVIGTEVPHTYQTRGVYRTQTHWRRRDFPAPWELRNPIPWDKFQDRVFPIANLSQEEIFPEETQNQYYQSSYDNASVRISARHSWQRTRDFDFMIGEFRWGCFDYLGETNQWPSRFANFGVIDICGFPKDIYYLYQSLWTKEPMVHLLPHWTHPGKEGVKIPVVVYTNCETAELFINNQSLGVQTYQDEQLIWQVPYTPGTLRVEGQINEKVVASKTVSTATEATHILITADKTKCQANQQDVVHLEIDIVDPSGTMVPQANNLIRFTIDGPTKLIGVDNGDPLDLAQYKIPQRKAFRGKCLLIIQATDRAGDINITANADGLQSQSITITSESA